MKVRILALTLLTLPPISIAQDYEAMFRHLYLHQKEGFLLLSEKYSEFEVESICITSKSEHAESMKYSHQGKGTIESRDNTFQVVLRHHIVSSHLEIENWMREKYFQGIIHYCTIDGFREVEGYAL